MPEILANIKSHIYPYFKKIFDFQGLTMFIYTENHAQFEFLNDFINLYGQIDVHIDFMKIRKNRFL